MRDDKSALFPSPLGLAGELAVLALRPAAAMLLQPALDAAMAAVARRRGAVFERLGPQAGAAFLIDPVDLPVSFLLCADPRRPRLKVASPEDAARADAVIRGPVLALIDLLEGRIDGDALFFSRELRVEGDTGAVVALRNAVDGEEIDVVDDVLSLAGPLAAPLRALARAAGRLLARASRDLEIVAGAFAARPRRRPAGAPAPEAPRAPAGTVPFPRRPRQGGAARVVDRGGGHG